MTRDHGAMRATVERSRNAGEPAMVAAIRALARVLEYAAALRSNGYASDVAIARAVSKHRASLALECVARAAWAMVSSDASTTRLAGSNVAGGDSP